MRTEEEELHENSLMEYDHTPDRAEFHNKVENDDFGEYGDTIVEVDPIEHLLLDNATRIARPFEES